MKYFGYACLSLLLALPAAAQSQFVYVNDNVVTGTPNSPNTVSAFKVSADGSLSLLANSPFKTGGNGGGNNIDPEEIAIANEQANAYLYAANDGSGNISAFRIAPNTGVLAHVTGSPFLADGAPGGDYSLATSPNGKFLFATADTTTVIHVYSIASTGALTEVAGSPYETGANSQGLKVTPNGQYLVVGEASLTAVGVYSISTSGTLTAALGSPFAASASPFDVAVNCAGNLVYVIDNGSFNGSYSAIDAYSISSSGTLTPVPGEPFYNGTSSTSGGLVLSPNGQFLFVTDTFSQDISSLAVSSDGALAQVAGSPFTTVDWTGGVAITRSGNYLYSVYFDSERVDGRAVGANGELTAVPGTPFSTEHNQLGVPTVITFPPPACPAG
ncbi:MAG: beta-propeller fold lactonase family protein [Candidatus Sulfotelmatobacter sp.]